MNKTKDHSVKIDPKTYKLIARLAKEQERDIKVIVKIAAEFYNHDLENEQAARRGY